MRQLVKDMRQQWEDMRRQLGLLVSMSQVEDLRKQLQESTSQLNECKHKLQVSLNTSES